MRRLRRASRGRVALTEAVDVTASAPGDPAILAAIHDAIAALPDTLRLPLVLHALEGLTHREVADLLDLTAGTCKRRVFEARTALRAVLGDGRDT
jgi:RNA polymerase sigma-70 factor, ECF subfamily